jgi:hypothetical protein
MDGRMDGRTYILDGFPHKDFIRANAQKAQKAQGESGKKLRGTRTKLAKQLFRYVIRIVYRVDEN